MLNLQKLRYLSCICAYCNKVIQMNERTNDHVIPRCSGGATEVSNIVICCQDCNSLKGNVLLNEFLEEHPEKAECFYNYLNMVDYQTGNDEYSRAIMEVLSESLKMSYIRKKQKEKKLRKKQKKTGNKVIATLQEEIQNIKYKLELSGKSFYVNEIQASILDYYLEHPDFSNYKELANRLGMSKSHIIKEITCINNLTGVFKLKKMSENGIILNDLLCKDLYRKISKTSR